MKYYSSWSNVTWFSIIILFIAIIGYREHGVDRAFYEAIVLSIFLLVFLTVLRYITSVETLNNRYLINRGFKFFSKDQVDIFSIKYIARAKAFLWKSGGSLMIIYIVNDAGELQQTTLREAAYSDKTIKAVLQNLKKINPHIKLTEQYEAFLQDKLEDNLSNTFTSLTPADTEQIVKEKLNTHP